MDVAILSIERQCPTHESDKISAEKVLIAPSATRVSTYEISVSTLRTRIGNLRRSVESLHIL